MPTDFEVGPTLKVKGSTRGSTYPFNIVCVLPFVSVFVFVFVCLLFVSCFCLCVRLSVFVRVVCERL